MATRRETAFRKQQLERWLREWSRQPEALAGGLLSSNRDLAEKYELSTFSVFSVVQSLVAEGVLVSERGVGVFSGGWRSEMGYFAVLTNATHTQRDNQLFEGFRTKISEFGVPSLLITTADVERWSKQNTSPTISGVLSLNYDSLGNSPQLIDAPTVGFYGLGQSTWDTVAFDDHVGGYWAAKHLMSVGHKKIAFLGSHFPDASISLDWSRERCRGWQSAMEESDFPTAGLNIRNTLVPDSPHLAIGRNAVDQVFSVPDVTAVIAANSLIAAGFLAELDERNVPRLAWPAIICFQDSDVPELVNMSSIYLDYAALGRAAAEVLFRKQEREKPEPQVFRVTPQLMPSLTSRTGWAQSMYSEPGENICRWLHDLLEPEESIQ